MKIGQRSMTAFRNVYEDEQRARAYANLDYPGTYYLAFRDIPQLLQKHIAGNRALDFGCGAGRSTRFLRDLGFDVSGIDVSEAMLREARSRDPEGRYVLVRDGFSALSGEVYDLVFCAFPFDNIPAADRPRLFRELAGLLSPDGRIVNLVSSTDIYVHEWLSFSTRDFPENRRARSGDIVRIVMLDGADQRPVEDVFWTDDDYAETFAAAGLELVESHRPLGNESDGFDWVSERAVSPWTIHVLRAARQERD
jgi:SAM-dependent methyltransferase